MKRTLLQKAGEVKEMLKHLNHCHDASLRKICFVKDRNIDKSNGSLIYPDVDSKEFVNCNIKAELILNSYTGAKKDQIILLNFKNATSFYFTQNNVFDYSDIYEITFQAAENADLSFDFFATGEKIKVLSILCKSVVCEEL